SVLSHDGIGGRELKIEFSVGAKIFTRHHRVRFAEIRIAIGGVFIEVNSVSGKRFGRRVVQQIAAHANQSPHSRFLIDPSAGRLRWRQRLLVSDLQANLVFTGNQGLIGRSHDRSKEKQRKNERLHYASKTKLRRSYTILG